MKWLVPLVAFFLALPCQAQIGAKASVPVADRAYSEALAKELTDQQLIDCLKGPKTCVLDNRYHNFYVLKRELAVRKHPDPIIAAYKKADDVDRYLLVQTLWLIDDPAVETFMRSIAFDYRGDGVDDSSGLFALDYLAHNCDLHALARLNRDVNFKTYKKMALNDTLLDVWDDTVEAFGRCNYSPAAQNLVHSLNPGCFSTEGTEQSPRFIFGNSGCLTTDEAEQSLKQIFPGYCSSPATVEEKQQCYESLLHADPKTTNH